MADRYTKGMTNEIQPEQLRTILKANLRSRRQELGLRQSDVASVAGITQAYYAQIEGGIRVPTLDILATLADALNTNPSALLAPDNFSKIPVDG